MIHGELQNKYYEPDTKYKYVLTNKILHKFDIQTWLYLDSELNMKRQTNYRSMQ